MSIKQVAERANVSTATVSRTINDSGKVNPRTSARVPKAIKELNFYPNVHARTLVLGRSNMLGLIISQPALATVRLSRKETGHHCSHGTTEADAGRGPCENPRVVFAQS